MKNLKKIAALVIVLAMALSTVSFAAFTDVKEDASYNEAVTVMSALGLLKGYEDGSFGPDKTITRAEFAAVVIRMLGLEDAAAGAATATNFTDVPATHWAAGYVKMANQKEIILGYGDGTFGPDAEVTYEQAIKMLVCALGYAPMFADVKDAYPTSYMAQANTLGMTIGAPGKIGDKATRATVARLVYNALDDALMEQTGFGSDKEYKVPDIYSTPLSKYLKIAKVDAQVKPVSFNAEDADKAGVVVTGIDDDVKEYDDLFAVVDEDDVEDEDFEEYDAIEGLDIPKGYAVTAFIDYNDDDYVVLAVVPKAGKNEVLELTAAQMKEAEIKFDEDELTYYKTSINESSRAEEVSLSKTLQIYVNKDVEVTDKSESTIAKEYKAGKYTSVKLINNNGGRDYDVMIITEVKSDIVDEIFDASQSITLANGGRVDFSGKKETITYSLKDVDGKELKFADIKVGDIINTIESNDGSGNKFFEYIISYDKVEGTVSEQDDNKVYIGGNEYIVGENVTVKPGDKGIFYVDITGTIIDKELDATSRTFGLLYAIYKDANGADEEIKATIYTKEGKFENFTFAKNVEFDGAAESIAATELVYDADNYELGYKDGDDFVTLIDAEDAQVIMYSANSSGAISSIVTAGKINAVTEKEYDYVAKGDAKKEYRDRYEGFDKKAVVDSSVIITNVDKAKLSNDQAKDNYALSTKAMFVDEEEYFIEYIYDVAAEEIAYAIVYDAKAKADPMAPIMYVSSDSSKGETEDGDAYYIIRGYVNGELKTINVDTDTWVEYASGAEGKAYKEGLITKGAVIQFNEGEIATAVTVIATADEILKAAADKTLTYGADEAEKAYLYAGVAEKYTKGSVYFVKAEGEEEEAVIPFKSGIEAVRITLTTNEDDDVIVNRIYAGYTVADAQTENAFGDENDDIVLIYNYDEENLACVIIDPSGNND